MKLKEIREKYLSLQIDGTAAYNALFDTGMSRLRCRELLNLWVSDEWERDVPPAGAQSGYSPRSWAQQVLDHIATVARACGFELEELPWTVEQIRKMQEGPR